jgi:hypothetical protein
MRTMAVAVRRKGRLPVWVVKTLPFGSDRYWREADVRRSGEVRKVPTGDSCTAANNIAKGPARRRDVLMVTML